MNQVRRTVTHAVSLGLLCGLGLLTAGCEEKPATPTADPVAAAPTPAPAPAPESAPGTGAVAADAALAADGLPATIPPPGSKPPTTAEWNAVTREVTVRGSTALNCETKMVREWLRVSCHTKGDDVPSNVETVTSNGQQAYVFNAAGLASVVLQVVPAKEYKAKFTWTKNGQPWTADLVVSWPGGAPRPSLALNR